MTPGKGQFALAIAYLSERRLSYTPYKILGFHRTLEAALVDAYKFPEFDVRNIADDPEKDEIWEKYIRDAICLVPYRKKIIPETEVRGVLRFEFSLQIGIEIESLVSLLRTEENLRRYLEMHVRSHKTQHFATERDASYIQESLYTVYDLEKLCREKLKCEISEGVREIMQREG